MTHSESKPLESILQPNLNVSFRNAAACGNLGLVKLLITTRINIDSEDVNGRTALRYAVDSSEWEAAKLLLLAGADPIQEDDNGVSPLGIAWFIKQIDLFKL